MPRTQSSSQLPPLLQGRAVHDTLTDDAQAPLPLDTRSALYFGLFVSPFLLLFAISVFFVNHTQTMRMFAAKSEWDMKMSVCVASAAMLAMSFFNLSMGVMESRR